MKPASLISATKLPSPIRKSLSKSPVRLKIKQASVQVLQSASLFKKPANIELVKKEAPRHLIINLSE